MHLRNLKIAFISIILVSCSTHNQATPTFYSLDWKLSEGEVVGYRTAMNQIDGSDAKITFNFDDLINGNDLANSIRGQMVNMELPKSSSMISVLERNPQGNIAVKLIVDSVDINAAQTGDVINDALNQMMLGMQGTVQLRGEITSDGAIASFYLEEQQRNLLAIFFELPTQPVQIGDRWSIDFNCISLGAGFIADHAGKVNQVELAELATTSDGKAVAVLDYIMAETASGNFVLPGSAEARPVSMNCSFAGRGEFLIEEGRWHQFTGEFALGGTGLMAADTVQQFALTPLTDIPEAYKTLE